MIHVPSYSKQCKHITYQTSIKMYHLMTFILIHEPRAWTLLSRPYHNEIWAISNQDLDLRSPACPWQGNNTDSLRIKLGRRTPGEWLLSTSQWQCLITDISLKTASVCVIFHNLLRYSLQHWLNLITISKLDYPKEVTIHDTHPLNMLKPF